MVDSTIIFQQHFAGTVYNHSKAAGLPAYCVCVQGHGFTMKASKGEMFGKYVTSGLETS